MIVNGVPAMPGPSERIAQARRSLEQGIGARTTIASAARSLGLSLHHFHRQFVAETGETPAAYVRRVRLDAAALRLRWTDDPAGVIAYSLGYASQAAFTRAFLARFGETPGRFRDRFVAGLDPAPGRATLRRAWIQDVEAFDVLVRRYTGDARDVRLYWRDFAASLPPALAGRRRQLFVGLLHDDPRLTPTHQIRYDCCVTLSEGEEAAVPAGLQRIRTRGGRYACLRHSGPWQAVERSYYLLCDHWLRQSRQTVTDDPAIEVHAVRRDLQSPEQLSFTILIPLE